MSQRICGGDYHWSAWYDVGGVSRRNGGHRGRWTLLVGVHVIQVVLRIILRRWVSLIHGHFLIAICDAHIHRRIPWVLRICSKARIVPALCKHSTHLPGGDNNNADDKE